MDIKKLLLIVFILIGVIPMLIMAGYSYVSIQSSLTKGIGGSSAIVAEATAQNLNEKINATINNMFTWSAFTSFITAVELAEDDSERGVHNLLATFKENYNAVYDLHLYAYDSSESSGKQFTRVAVSDDKLLKSPIPSYIDAAIKTFEKDSKRKSFITLANAEYEKTAENETDVFLNIVTPIYSDEDLMGVLAWEVIFDISQNETHDQFTILYDDNGKVIAHPKILNNDEIASVTQSYVSLVKKDGAKDRYLTSNIINTPYLVSYAHNDGFGNGGITIAVMKNSNIALKAVNDMTMAFIVISIVVIVIVLIIAFIVANFISKPLVSMCDSMSLLAEGNLDVHVPVSLDRKDEIGQMANALQTFKETAIQAKKMADDQADLERQMEEEKKTSMNALADDFDNKVGGLISSLAGASTELEATAQSMQTLSEHTSTSSTQMASSTEQTIVNVSTVSSAMVEMTASSDEISSQVTTANERSNDTVTNAQKASDVISNLNELVENIGGVAVSIGDIAEQTNLLALNATIEAARAGDAGRGFAVVADEVKSLATETAQKTEEINDRIAQVQDATLNSVEAMNLVIENISGINESVTSISAAIEEQNATTTEVSRSISEVSVEAQEMSSIVTGVQKDSEEARDSSSAVLEAAKEVSIISENINSFVGDFLQQIRSSE